MRLCPRSAHALLIGRPSSGTPFHDCPLGMAVRTPLRYVLEHTASPPASASGHRRCFRRCSNPSPQKSKSHARPSSAPRLRHRVLVASSRHAMPPAHHPKRSGLDGARVSVKEQTKSPTRTCRLTCASPQAEPFRRPTTLPLDPPRRKAARACIGFAADLKTLFCAEARGNLRRGNPLKSGVL